MKKGKKLTTKIKLHSGQSVDIEGVVLDNRTVFGREEVLVDVTKIAPIWFTKERLS